MELRNKDERLADFADRFVFYHDGEIAEKYLRNGALMAYLNDGGFFTAPASTKYHGVYEGGLYDHSRTVMEELENITACMGLRWQREESPFIVGMFHDLCKCDQYKLIRDNPEIVYHGENGNVIQTLATYHYEYNDKLLLTGHGAKSVMILSQFFALTEEEILCIRYHMGAYEKDDWTGLDLAMKKYPTVWATHSADMIASKVRGT